MSQFCEHVFVVTQIYQKEGTVQHYHGTHLTNLHSHKHPPEASEVRIGQPFNCRIDSWKVTQGIARAPQFSLSSLFLTRFDRFS